MRENLNKQKYKFLLWDIPTFLAKASEKFIFFQNSVCGKR